MDSNDRGLIGSIALVFIGFAYHSYYMLNYYYGFGPSWQVLKFFGGAVTLFAILGFFGIIWFGFMKSYLESRREKRMAKADESQ